MGGGGRGRGEERWWWENGGRGLCAFVLALASFLTFGRLTPAPLGLTFFWGGGGVPPHLPLIFVSAGPPSDWHFVRGGGGPVRATFRPKRVVLDFSKFSLKIWKLCVFRFFRLFYRFFLFVVFLFFLLVFVFFFVSAVFFFSSFFFFLCFLGFSLNFIFSPLFLQFFILHVSCLFLSFFFNFSMCCCFLLDVSVFF